LGTVKFTQVPKAEFLARWTGILPIRRSADVFRLEPILEPEWLWVSRTIFPVSGQVGGNAVLSVEGA
jgi:hypothetical protein